MQTLFDSSDRQSILQRLERLEATSQRQWGKMDPAQMLTHCSRALEMATGDQVRGQKFIGRILGPFFRSTLLGEKPFSHDAPTDPAFIVTDSRDFATERERLTTLVHRFSDQGPAGASQRVHSFLGKLTGEEWGRMMHKHLDHHLRQFGQ